LGVLFGILQIVLYGIYRKHGKSVAKHIDIDKNVNGTQANGRTIGLVEKPREVASNV
jgi:hypothetical protein